MGFGIDLVNRIDQVLSDTGMSRKEFGEKLNIVQSTLATWKSRDICPPVDTLSKIADELEVSLDWLIAGYPGWGVDKETFGENSREAVRERIYKALIKKDELPSEEELARIHTENKTSFPISYQALRNWSKGRISLDMYFFQQMAYNLKTNIQYLLTGQDDKLPQDFDPVLFKAARENANSVHCLYNLSEDKKKIVSDMLNKLMELEHLEHVSKK
ncbi:helix-turn-helix transcriptional regulator [Treponema bryantii]|uniref:helix-turn-helix domain-containing protein n=1 Tax=Treponema bryantii TaxID=163 RepID=UPI002B2E0962|nr:hypothetical protein TRBR_04270 [Treponema bryantii]